MTLVLPAPLDVVDAAYNGSIAVEIGDLLFHDTDDAKPASSQADQGTEAANQAAFAPRFLGVSVERKLATDAAGTIQVAVDVIRQYDCVSSTFEIGDLVTVDEASSGTALENQLLVKTTDPLLAIGYAIERAGSGVTKIWVRLLSNVLPQTTLGSRWAPTAITAAVAAAGSTVANAAQLGDAAVVHITSDSAAKGVKLPAVAAPAIKIVINDSATAAKLYAESGGTVNGLTADAAVVVAASKGLLCFATAAKTWVAFDLTAKATTA